MEMDSGKAVPTSPGGGTVAGRDVWRRTILRTGQKTLRAAAEQRAADSATKVRI